MRRAEYFITLPRSMTSKAWARRISVLLGTVFWFTLCWAWANTFHWLKPWENVVWALGCTILHPLASLLLLMQDSKTQHFYRKKYIKHMAGPKPVRSNRFGAQLLLCTPAPRGKASKPFPAIGKKASPHLSDLTNSVLGDLLFKGYFTEHMGRFAS